MKHYDNVKWYINNSCNLSCPFCFVKGVKGSEVSLETKFKILDKLFTDGVEYVDFFGKEPLLNEDIFKIMNHGENNNYDMYYSFISNGVNLKKYTQDIINSPCRDFTISFDFHSNDRKFKFNLEDLLPFKEQGFYIELSVDVHSNNIGDILSKTPELQKFGVSSLYFNPIMPFKDVEVNSIKETEYNDFITKFLGCYKNDYGITFKIPFQMRELSKKYTGNSNFHTEPCCTGGLTHFCISSDGRAFGCVSQCANGNLDFTSDYLTTSIDDIYHRFKRPMSSMRLCEV